jgi:hypothetical protein
MSYINGSVRGFQGIGGGLLPNSTSITGGGGISGSNVIMDNAATGNQFASAPQTEGVWYGSGTKANSSVSSVTVGNYTRSLGTGGVAIGSGVAALQGAKADVNSGIAIGGSGTAGTVGALVTGTGGIAIGSAQGATAGASVASADGIAIGKGASVSGGAQSTAVGQGATTTAINSVAMGTAASAFASEAVAVGSGAIANASQSIALGSGAVADAADSISIGTAAATDGITAIAIGDNSYSTTEATAVGASAAGNATGGTACGAFARANATEGTAVGYNANVYIASGIALGSGAESRTWVLNTQSPLAISPGATAIGGGAPGAITNRLRIRINGVNYTIPLCADV